MRGPARSHNVSDHHGNLSEAGKLYPNSDPDNADGMVVLFEERFGSADSRPARPSAAYERSVRGSPKCRNTPVSANQVIPAIVSPASVSTISP